MTNGRHRRTSSNLILSVFVNRRLFSSSRVGGLFVGMIDREPTEIHPPAALSVTNMKTSFRNLVRLGALAIATATFAVASDDSQVAIDSFEKQALHKWWSPSFDALGDIADQWVENGREFISRNGQICEHLRR